MNRSSKTILRVTRHQLLAPIRLDEELVEKFTAVVEASNASQIAKLKHVFGEDIKIVELAFTFSDDTVNEIKTLIAEHGADIVEFVLPPDKIAKIFHPHTGVKETVFIKANMSRVSAPLSTAPNNVLFVFDDNSSYDKYVKVEVVTVRL